MKLDGTLQARYDYDAYGRRMTITQNANYLGGCDFGYTGHFTRTALVAGRTELVLTHFRAYDPTLGRWLCPDPLGELGSDGPNLYGYVQNNPLNMYDSDGRWGQILAAGIIGGIASGIAGGISTGSWEGALAGAVGGALTAATFNPASGASAAALIGGEIAAGVAGGAATGIVDPSFSLISF
ncbi:MAG: RHS repeat-associated core domain-containing protein [Akkermansiaceae bacterium]|nr:RHS repeat-associated core domain-containing protein [Akkermansiaceae bacterium]